jgi:transposase-like protein
MYSYEDRLRAVRLHIKLGKRVVLTIRQLGYPTKKALKAWRLEYEQHRDLPWCQWSPNNPQWGVRQKTWTG